MDVWETKNDLYEDELLQHLYCLIKQHARQRKSPIKAFDPKLLRTPTIQRLLGDARFWLQSDLFHIH